MSRELEIVCVACKCNPDDEIFNDAIQDLPENNVDEMSKVAKDFRQKHNHARCVVRTKKDYKYDEDKKFRNNLINEQRKK